MTSAALAGVPRLGDAVRRLEDRRLLTGRGRFVDDVETVELAHAAILRSPFAHARLVAIDAGAARAAAGVLAVLTASDLDAAGIGALPCLHEVRSQDGKPMDAPPRRLLAGDTVRHVGDAVAMVVAETADAACDAVELIEVEYEELPAHPSIEDPEAVCFDWAQGDADAVAAAFRGADRVVAIEVVNNRIAVTPIEPRSALATWDRERGRATLETQSQGVHVIRDSVAAALGIDADRLRVVTGDVGGSFGMKLAAYPEQALVVHAAERLGRPVRWTATRGEAFLADAHSRDHRDRAELALDRDGRFLALRVEVRANLGAYPSTFGPMVPTSGLARVFGHVYRFPAVHLRVLGMLTHTVPVDAYRGAGKPEIVYLIERLIDRAARECGIDRVELRRRNVVARSEMPWRSPLGLVWDRGDFAERLDAALALADWDGFARRRERSLERGRLRGIGLGMHLHATGGNPIELSRVRLRADATIEVLTGMQASGQGHETTFAQLAAARLGLPIERVHVVQGDSDRLERGGGSGGSSSLTIGATTIARACEEFLVAARERAAATLGVAVDGLEYGHGRFSVPGTNLALDLFELAPTDDAGPSAEAAFEGDHLTCPNGAYVCEVEVDPQTGRVAIVAWSGADDIGTVLHPAIALGQIRGGLAQAIGQALLEEVTYEPESGQLLSGSLVDYCVPRADDLPRVALDLGGEPTTSNPLGMKGAGEVGTIGGCAPLVNAVADAIGHDRIEMPLTPERIWRALGASGADGA